MRLNSDDAEVIRRAIAGDRGNLSALADLAHGRVRAYVQRVVLNEDRAQDITQEAMAAMLASLDQLRNPDRFWPWVFTIASNKMRQSFRRADLRPVSLSDTQNSRYEPRSRETEPVEGLSRLELVELTRRALEDLDVRYRMVLAMRFYEDMPHAAISSILGCSELTARVTFLRAKRALVRALNRLGVRKASLMAALLAFGSHTAPSQAASICVGTRAVTETLTRGMLSWRSGVAAAACLVLLIVWNLPPNRSLSAAHAPGPGISHQPASPRSTAPAMACIRFQAWGAFLGAADRTHDQLFDTCIYYPEGWNGPHLITCVPVSTPDDAPHGSEGYVLSAHGNMVVEYPKRRVRLRNEKVPCCFPHTAVLPTDPADFCQFIGAQESEGTHAYVNKPGFNFDRDPLSGFVTSGLQARASEPYPLRFEIVHPKPGMDLVNYVPPPEYQVVDRRDTMHRREWTRFKIGGHLGTHAVSGEGCIPFTYAASLVHPAWFRAELDGRWEISDDFHSARITSRDGTTLATYPGGSFWQGLSRPWEGFSTADSVRRDAARSRIPYALRRILDSQRMVAVGLPGDGSESSTSSVSGSYFYDEERDVVERIRLSTPAGGPAGTELVFEYAENVSDGDALAVASIGPRAAVPDPAPGLFWPAEVLRVTYDTGARLSSN